MNSDQIQVHETDQKNRFSGADKESNWLPAPNGPIYLVMRLFWPKEHEPSILPPGQGTWKPPGIVKVNLFDHQQRGPLRKRRPAH